jgi:hypothetical protein
VAKIRGILYEALPSRFPAPHVSKVVRRGYRASAATTDRRRVRPASDETSSHAPDTDSHAPDTDSSTEHVGTAQCDAVASLVVCQPSSSSSSSAATSSILSSSTTTSASASSAAPAAAAAAPTASGAQASSRGGWLGFAFLHFRDKAEAADAIETLEGQIVHSGSTMRLQWADARKGATKNSDPTTPHGETTLNVQHLLLSSANDS